MGDRSVLTVHKCHFELGSYFGKAIFRVDGGNLGCGNCRRIVYRDTAVIANHVIAWHGSYMTWHSRDFGFRVHTCTESTESGLHEEAYEGIKIIEFKALAPSTR